MGKEVMIPDILGIPDVAKKLASDRQGNIWEFQATGNEAYF
uniref:Uncharacterized protein n=1 Tax=Rhizophora mucronata TaxID=61149 RepID=A0A2P2P0V2_RHIMU